MHLVQRAEGVGEPQIKLYSWPSHILLFSSDMKIQTERNLKSFQIQNLAVKTALKQANLHVKGAKTPTDTENARF